MAGPKYSTGMLIGKFPRRLDRPHAHGPADRHDSLIGIHDRNGLPFEAASLLSRQGEPIGRRSHLAFRLPNRFSVLDDEAHGQVRLPGKNDLGDAVAPGGSLMISSRLVLGECLRRSVHRQVNVLGTCRSQLGDLVAGSGAGEWVGPAIRGLDPLVADQELVSRERFGENVGGTHR